MKKQSLPQPLSVAAIIGFIQTLDFTNKRLEEENELLKSSKANVSKFHAKTLTVEQVAYLHDVHPNTVRRYVNNGLIEKHPTSSSGKIFIRASDALVLDFAELRRKSNQLIYRNV